MAKKGEAYYRYSYEELSAFCLQISLLLEAAVPLEEGLAIMAEDAAAQSEKDMLLYMAEGVELGPPSSRLWRIRAFSRLMWCVWPSWDSRQEPWTR